MEHEQLLQCLPLELRNKLAFLERDRPWKVLTGILATSLLAGVILAVPEFRGHLNELTGGLAEMPRPDVFVVGCCETERLSIQGKDSTYLVSIYSEFDIFESRKYLSAKHSF